MQKQRHSQGFRHDLLNRPSFNNPQQRQPVTQGINLATTIKTKKFITMINIILKELHDKDDPQGPADYHVFNNGKPYTTE